MANEQRKASQTSTGYTRTVEKAFEDSEYTGELDLSGHKLPELPDYAGSYELNSLISVGEAVYSMLEWTWTDCVNELWTNFILMIDQ